MDANQIKAQYQGYAGWNDPAAILADFKATGGAGKGGPTNSGVSQSTDTGTRTTPVDYTQIAQEQQRIQQEAVKPVVASLEAQKAPLQARYDNLIKQLQGKETQEVGAQQTALSQEYGKRGIPLSSGAFSQDLMGKTQAITQNYAGLQGEAVASEQADLANLATTIAQAQASGNTQAATNAMTLWQQTQAQKEADRTYQNVTLPTTQANLANIQSEIANRGKSTGTDLSSLLALLGGSTTSTSTSAEKEPQYSTAEGSYSKGGGWIFTGGKWYQVTD
jgi:hypothetical protein